jgi:hypothetical protein
MSSSSLNLYRNTIIESSAPSSNIHAAYTEHEEYLTATFVEIFVDYIDKRLRVLTAPLEKHTN